MTPCELGHSEQHFDSCPEVILWNGRLYGLETGLKTAQTLSDHWMDTIQWREWTLQIHQDYFVSLSLFPPVYQGAIHDSVWQISHWRWSKDWRRLHLSKVPKRQFYTIYSLQFCEVPSIAICHKRYFHSYHIASFSDRMFKVLVVFLEWHFHVAALGSYRLL